MIYAGILAGGTGTRIGNPRNAKTISTIRKQTNYYSQ